MLDFTAQISENDDGFKAVKDILEELKNTEVLVGIMEDAGVHDSETQTGITNAELLYIHTTGSPINGLAARPVLEPAIQNHSDQLGSLLGKAAEAALNGDVGGMNIALDKAGTQGMNAARGWFTNPANDWAKLKPSTIKSRYRKMSKAQKKKTDAKISEANGDTGAAYKPLVDSGELRKAITYTVKRKA